MTNLHIKLHIKLAGPRGFCAGVVRAIEIVERALAKFGAPVYVRHQIVHNPHVVARLEQMGAIFVKELGEVPQGTTQPVVFSAHGVAKSVVAEAEARGFMVLDGTCPLVSKVHMEAQLHHRLGRHVVLVGHKGHVEVVGTMGQVPACGITLVETVADVAALNFAPNVDLAFTTQTTLSVDETADIIAALRQKYPKLVGPKKEDICYATTNRQAAVKQIAKTADLFLVVGAQNSSNSNRLVETALSHGAKAAYLINDAREINWDWLTDDVQLLGLSSGASAPEDLVQGVLAALAQRFIITTEEVVVAVEDVLFNVPRILA